MANTGLHPNDQHTLDWAVEVAKEFKADAGRSQASVTIHIEDAAWQTIGKAYTGALGLMGIPYEVLLDARPGDDHITVLLGDYPDREGN